MPRRRTTRVCSCTTCCGGSTRPARATTTSTSPTCSSGTAPTATRCASWSARHARRCPSAGAAGAAHEVELARFHRQPAPMFMATARIDAIWIHDGMLDARDYKTGRCGTTRVCRRPGREGAGVRARTAAQRRGSAAPAPLRVPAARGRRRSRAVGARRRRAGGGRRGAARGRRRACGTSTTGAASPTSTCAAAAGTGRSVATAPRRASPRGRCSAPGPTVPDARVSDERRSSPVPRMTAAPAFMASGLSAFPSSSVSAGRRSTLPAEAARAPIELLADAARAADADAGRARCSSGPTSSRSCTSGRGRTPIPGAFLARRLGIAPRATAVSTVGGNSPQLLVNEMAERIQRGRVRRRADRRRGEHARALARAAASRAWSSRGRPATTRRARG